MPAAPRVAPAPVFPRGPAPVERREDPRVSLRATSVCLLLLGLAFIGAGLIIRRSPALRARGVGIFVFGTGVAAAGAMGVIR